MKYLWLILTLILIIPDSAYAYDQYYKSGVTWHEQIGLKPNINIQSVQKLSKHDIRLMRKTYKLTKELFFQYFYLNPDQCNLGKFKIKIVRNHYDLDNRKYFPNEFEYADPPNEGTAVIFGRYYRATNTLYIVPLDEEKYHWRRDFSHEILHYFFDECGIKFINDDAEHEKVYEFLNRYKKIFD